MIDNNKGNIFLNSPRQISTFDFDFDFEQYPPGFNSYPFTFNIYTSNLHAFLENNGNIVQYADDLCIYSTHKSPNILVQQLSEPL